MKRRKLNHTEDQGRGDVFLDLLGGSGFPRNLSVCVNNFTFNGFLADFQPVRLSKKKCSPWPTLL